MVMALCAVSWADDKIMRTETERNADIDRAINEIGNVPEADRVNFRDGLKKSRANFLRLYRARWQALGMNDKLEKAIDRAFQDKTGGMLWGTKGLRLGANIGNIVNDIQEATAFNFAETYDDFLRDVEDKWGESLQGDLSDFYKRASIMLIAADRNPMMRAYIRQSTAAQGKNPRRNQRHPHREISRPQNHRCHSRRGNLSAFPQTAREVSRQIRGEGYYIQEGCRKCRREINRQDSSPCRAGNAGVVSV